MEKKQEKTIVIEKLEKFIKKNGPRLFGTKGDKRTAFYLKKEFKKYCDRVEVEKFKASPEAFLGFTKILPILYSISLIFVFLNKNIIALLFLSLIIIIAISQFIFYQGWFDFLYKKKNGYNVIGKIYPKKEERKIIICAHHDSAKIFRFLDKHPKLYSLRVILAFVVVILSFILISFGIFISEMSLATKVIMIICLPAIVEIYFFVENKGSLGASDNLISSMILIELAKIFKSKKLDKIQLILLSADGEEIGLKGSEYFIKKREKELSRNTIAIIIDSISSSKSITILDSEINGLIHSSKELTENLKDVATREGIRVSIKNMVLGGGSTDAGSFDRHHVEAVSIIAMPMDTKHGVHYHNSSDTVDNIDKSTITKILNILVDYIQKQDNK